MRLDLLRIEVLPGAEHDDFFLAACDVEAPIAVDPSEIARSQPAVVEHVAGRLRVVEIFAHDDPAADENFADAGTQTLEITGLRVSGPGTFVGNADVDAGKRLSDRGRESIAEADDGGATGCFRQPGTRSARRTPTRKVTGDGRIETGPTRDEKADRRSELSMHAGKIPSAWIQAADV